VGGAEEAKPHRYKVQVWTSDKRGAGTDANVTLRIKATSGRDSGPLKLDNSKNNFERGMLGEEILPSHTRCLASIIFNSITCPST
jgi:hypothetical protein